LGRATLQTISNTRSAVSNHPPSLTYIYTFPMAPNGHTNGGAPGKAPQDKGADAHNFDMPMRLKNKAT